MDGPARPRTVAQLVLLAVVGLLLAASVFAGGGSRDDALATVGLAALVAAAVGLGAAVLGVVPLPRLDRAGWVTVVASASLAVWLGVSTIWSIAGERSWEWLGRGLVYLAFVALGLLVGVFADGVRRLAAVLAAVLGAALGWALLGVAVPRFFEDGDRIARLREPVGYWNALALLADAALVLALWLARGRRSSRWLGALLGYAATLALLLTQSRAGVVAGIAVLVLWLALSDERVEDGLRLVVLTGPALLVAGWAFTRPALVEDGAARSDRVADGRVFAGLALVGAAVAVAAILLLPARRAVAEHRRRVLALVVTACAVVALAGLGALVASVGNPVSWASSQVSEGECANEPGRLTELCANNRLAWWDEALEIAAGRPLGGSGAGTFAIARLRYRDDATPVSQPHSVPLQLLADTGLVGLALGALVVVGAVVAVRRGLRLASLGERPAAVALACLLVAYGVHALVDYPLDFLAVTAPAAVALGALLALRRPPAAVRARATGLIAVAAALAASALVVVLPALAERQVDRSLAEVDAGRIAAAVDAADRARLLDPLSRDALDALAVAADAAGDEAGAVAWYEEATRLQPENPDTWYALGLYHVLATEDLCAAYFALNRSHTLDPSSTRWVKDGPLDRARDAVNNGACERP
ncbi:MAG TPA: O-antigen ligase family protein [Gaiellaceae bacterium]|nr:O-antigen ligase family protein [Gaiellaceae bacterium]